MLRRLAMELADAIEASIEPWIRRAVATRSAQAAIAVDADLLDSEIEAAVSTVGAEIRELLNADVDQQRSNPLSILRAAVRYPTAVLAAAGVPPVRRADFETQRFPDDVYNLSPAAFDDVDPALREPGIVWGAAKAHVHMARHRSHDGLLDNDR